MHPLGRPAIREKLRERALAGFLRVYPFRGRPSLPLSEQPWHIPRRGLALKERQSGMAHPPAKRRSREPVASAVVSRAIPAMVQSDLLEQCQEVLPHHPTRCRGCGAALTGDDPEPLRHQVVEIPAIVPFVIEHQLHRLSCPCCRTVTAAVLPVGVERGGYGPRLSSLVGLLDQVPPSRSVPGRSTPSAAGSQTAWRHWWRRPPPRSAARRWRTLTRRAARWATRLATTPTGAVGGYGSWSPPYSPCLSRC